MVTLRELVQRGQSPFGLALCYNCPGIVERVGRDWDWIWVDAQHGQFSYDDVVSAVRAVEVVGGRAVLRAPGKSAEWLGLYADLAPAGIMVPMVNNADEARDVVKALRFPPLGERSYGSRRAGDLYGPRYYSELDLFVMAQIETVEAVENAPAIAAVEGIDCLFFGANDVKLAMGLPQEIPIAEAPQVHAAMQRAADGARAAGKSAGCVAVGESAIRLSLDMGYQLLASGADQLFLREGSVAALRTARGISSLEVTVASNLTGRTRAAVR